MKKIATILSMGVFILFTSCKKDNQCWDCHVGGTVNGITYDYNKEYCGPEPIPQETDPNGNQLPMFCKPK